MKVTYLYHSGFVVESDESMLIFDYYKGELPKAAKDKKLYVFSSHAHKDHFQEEIFTWAKDYDVTYILSRDIRRKGPEGKVVKVRAREEYEIDALKIKTLRSTDTGVAFFVRFEGMTVYHAGDLNWWHWKEETDTYNAGMKKAYQKEISILEGERIDLAFVPLDPRQEEAYSLGADYFMRHTHTRYLFPMHLWGSYKTIARFIRDPLSDGYRDRIVSIERRGQEFLIEEEQ